MIEVRTATYGPGIDQSQHAKSVSHIIKQTIAVVYAGRDGCVNQGLGNLMTQILTRALDLV